VGAHCHRHPFRIKYCCLFHERGAMSFFNWGFIFSSKAVMQVFCSLDIFLFYWNVSMWSEDVIKDGLDICPLDSGLKD
jgi:hypothetical protein